MNYTVVPSLHPNVCNWKTIIIIIHYFFLNLVLDKIFHIYVYINAKTQNYNWMYKIIWFVRFFLVCVNPLCGSRWSSSLVSGLIMLFRDSSTGLQGEEGLMNAHWSSLKRGLFFTLFQTAAFLCMIQINYVLCIFSQLIGCLNMLLC